MGKLIVLLCFALLAMTLVMACGGPGFTCTSNADCCSSMCLTWKRRCIGAPGWGPAGPGGNVQWPVKAPKPTQ